jgi:hypothetical protein
MQAQCFKRRGLGRGHLILIVTLHSQARRSTGAEYPERSSLSFAERRMLRFNIFFCLRVD